MVDDKNIGIKQLGPAIFNIPSDVQQKMIINLLDAKYGYTVDELKNLWLETQKSLLDEKNRDSVVYKLDKIYKKKGATAESFYVAKLQKEYKKSGMEDIIKKNNLGAVPPEAVPAWPPNTVWQKENYGKFQTIINCFLYNLKKNDFFEWALDYNKFKSWSQELSHMFVTVPTSKDKLKEDIAKNNKKFLIESRSGLIEASLNITRQCLASCGQKPKKGGPGNQIKCYICGEPINDLSGELPDGSQCEHVVPVTSLAALCGLSGDDYEKTIDNYFEEYSEDKTKNGNINIDGLIITRDNYNLWRKRLIGDPDNNNNPRDAVAASDNLTREHGGGSQTEGVLYRWAHPACNMIKKDYAFLGLSWAPARDSEEWDEMKKVGFPILNPREVAAAAGAKSGAVSAKSGANSTNNKKVIYDYCDEEGIKHVLNCLSNIKEGGGASLSSAWRKKFFPGNKAKQLTTKWVEGRYNAMRDNTMKWAANSILSRDPNSGIYNSEYGIEEDKWPEYRTTLCEISMSILDFRVEEKIKLHYKKFIKKDVNDDDLKAIVEEWRKAEWIDLVGQDPEEEVAGAVRFPTALGDTTNLYPNPNQKIDPPKTPRRGEKEMRPEQKRQKTVSFNGNPKKLDLKDLHFSLGKETTRKKTKIRTRKTNLQPINDTSKNIDQIEEMKKFSDYFSHLEDTRMDITGKRTRGVKLLKELNDKKLILQIYLDVLNPIEGVYPRLAQLKDKLEKMNVDRLKNGARELGVSEGQLKGGEKAVKTAQLGGSRSGTQDKIGAYKANLVELILGAVATNKRLDIAKAEAKNYRSKLPQYNFETFNIDILPKTLQIHIINETKSNDSLNEISDDTDTETRNVRQKAEKKKKRKSKKKNTNRKKKNTKSKKKNTKRKNK